jgi:hypothetical protein
MTAPTRDTAAQRRSRPSLREIAVATAEQQGMCIRPMVMKRLDTATRQQEYVPVPCGNTRESECPACAARARALRIQQCREGWHAAAEPVEPAPEPTAWQTETLARLADLIASYYTALDNDDADTMRNLRNEIEDLRAQLRASGLRGAMLPSIDEPVGKPRAKRSTRRRQDAPDLPRRKVVNTTIGRTYAGKFQPSMFVTLTLPSYGRVHPDGTPVRPDAYDYRRAARDTVHFAALFDRWMQNLRRVVGWNVQYFAAVEPQRRGAPHIHLAIRGAISHDVIRRVTQATYHQVWQPNHDQAVYRGERMPVWDERAATFVDPDTRQPLTAWDDAVQQLAEDPDAKPAHVVRFGVQVDSKGILGGTEESGRHIGYLTKYLTKSVSEVLEATTDRQQAHHDRLHAELDATPCGRRCPVWLRYGVVPHGADRKTRPGRCKGKAHRRDTLGLPGRRVLVSRRWSGKTLPDHRADRQEFVRSMLADIGIGKPAPDPDRYEWFTVHPGDPATPPLEHLLMAAIAQRTRWRAEYERARINAGLPPPDSPETSATRQAA